MEREKIEWVECPRDAMQGLSWYIPAEVKTHYLNTLLKVGFDVIDFGSFVSPKAIPQLRDTAEVLSGLEVTPSTKLLAIVANARGGETASSFDEITYLGFPFSISETFQQRNTNSSIENALSTVETLQHLCLRRNKELVVYISMAFGNPYGDPWSDEIAVKWTQKIAGLGVKTIALSDTVGLADPAHVGAIFQAVIPALPDVKFGAHLHCTPDNWRKKVNAAWSAGCRRFDTALKGYGGCPMAEDELVGNLASEKLLQFLDENKVTSCIDKDKFGLALAEAASVFTEPLTT
ncbi:MAG: hydroxymethylglutaryl-CoA lyase [Bacteroidia bacterium]|nr:hydroxymethylglutaryl-CoA lyase [Bacteroidia bacterium]